MLWYGRVAQLRERYFCTVEVGGLTPPASTLGMVVRPSAGSYSGFDPIGDTESISARRTPEHPHIFFHSQNRDRLALMNKARREINTMDDIPIFAGSRAAIVYHWKAREWWMVFDECLHFVERFTPQWLWGSWRADLCTWCVMRYVD